MRRGIAGAGLALLFCSCAGTRVTVRDPTGRPVAGAKVRGLAASITTAVVTDARGEARLPWTIQDVGWVHVRDDGYCPTVPVDVRGKPRAITVVLHPRDPEGKTPCHRLGGYEVW